jgi:hypothetical protein
MNSLLRFVLELVALGMFGRWGFMSTAGTMRYVWMLGLPLLAAVIWGTFTTPGDPSRGQDGPVRVPGLVRLALEMVFFGSAVAACYALSSATWASLLGAIVGLHYAWAHARLAWLLRQG